LKNSYDYLPFGGAHSPGTDVTVEQRYTYTGREKNPESALMYYRYRQYDPRVGRFGGRDVLGGRYNRYGYVAARPTYYVDPLGLEAWSAGLEFLAQGKLASWTKRGWTKQGRGRMVVIFEPKYEEKKAELTSWSFEYSPSEAVNSAFTEAKQEGNDIVANIDVWLVRFRGAGWTAAGVVGTGASFAGVVGGSFFVPGGVDPGSTYVRCRVRIRVCPDNKTRDWEAIAEEAEAKAFKPNFWGRIRGKWATATYLWYQTKPLGGSKVMNELKDNWPSRHPAHSSPWVTASAETESALPRESDE
jgi:RHS repeat-associated protein